MKLESIREKSLEWFFAKTEDEKKKLKDKYFPNSFISYSNHWGYEFTFGQIEDMFKKETN